jgi:leader peptidase (prepilin peptidase)/N-methyltransferase
MFSVLPLLGPAYLVGVAWPLARTDIRSHRLPNRLTLPVLPLAAASQALTAVFTGEWSRFGTSLGCAFLAFIVGLGVNRTGVLGMGDVKLITGITLCLAWFNPIAPLYALAASFAVATVAVLFLFAKRKTSMGSSIPLGPYLLFGFLIALVQSF